MRWGEMVKVSHARGQTMGSECCGSPVRTRGRVEASWSTCSTYLFSQGWGGGSERSFWQAWAPPVTQPIRCLRLGDGGAGESMVLICLQPALMIIHCGCL